MTIKWNTGNAAARFRLNKKKKKATSYKPQATSHKLQATSHKPQAARRKMKLNTKEKCTIIDLINLNIKDTTGDMGVRSYRKFLRNLKEKFKLTPDEEKEEKKLYF